MSKNVALAITRNEWKEIIMLPEVQVEFELTAAVPSIDDLAMRAYGAKFVLEDLNDPDFEYVVYTLVGDYDKKQMIVLERVHGVLREMKSNA